MCSSVLAMWFQSVEFTTVIMVAPSIWCCATASIVSGQYPLLWKYSVRSVLVHCRGPLFDQLSYTSGSCSAILDASSRISCLAALSLLAPLYVSMAGGFDVACAGCCGSFGTSAGTCCNDIGAPRGCSPEGCRQLLSRRPEMTCTRPGSWTSSMLLLTSWSLSGGGVSSGSGAPWGPREAGRCEPAHHSHTTRCRTSLSAGAKGNQATGLAISCRGGRRHLRRTAGACSMYWRRSLQL
jgi:hypothetical protein